MMDVPLFSRRAVLAGGASALAACGGDRQAYPGDLTTLVILKASESSTLDPAFMSTIHDLGPVSLLYERLARHETIDGVPTGMLVGEVAESWESNSDATVWTIRLRQDRRFEDGTAVDAAAVMFTRDRNMKANPAFARDSTLIRLLEALDPYTLRYSLSEPSTVFPHFLAYPQSSVISPASMAKAVDGDFGRAWLSQNSAGSGAYRLESWARGQSMTLAASQTAYKKPAYFTRVEYRPIPDEGSRRLVFDKGSGDILEGIALDGVVSLAQNGAARLVDQPSPRWVGVAYNTRLAPLDDVRVRRAMDWAIDREGMIKGVMLGHALPMSSPLPPGVPGYQSGPPRPRDLAKARGLLLEAGFGPDRPLRLQLNFFKDDSAIEGTALTLQANLAEVGVEIELRMLAPAANLQAAQTGQFEMAIVRTAPPMPDPWAVLEYPFRTSDPGARGGNFSAYSNTAVDALLDQALAEQELGARNALYLQAAKLIQDDVPISFLYAGNGFLGVRKGIRNLEYSAWFPYHYNAASMTRA